MLILQKGRPEDPSGRPGKELRVYDLLDRLEIRYDRVDHEALATMEACIEVDELLDVNMCKNLFLCNAQKTKFYLLLMPGEKKFVTKDLSQQIGSSRLSFASPEDMVRLMDLTPGSVTVMGLMNDTDHQIQLLIDEDILQDVYLACHPCINTSSIKLKTEELIHKFLPEVGHKPIIVKL